MDGPRVTVSKPRRPWQNTTGFFGLATARNVSSAGEDDALYDVHLSRMRAFCPGVTVVPSSAEKNGTSDVNQSNGFGNVGSATVLDGGVVWRLRS